MIVLIVYADILVILNTLVNYFLISAVNYFLKNNTKNFRIILSASVGGILSLYIFLPEVILIVEILFKLITCVLLSLIAFGFRYIKRFIKNSLCIFGVTCLYGGLMFAIWNIFKPKGMFVNNSVVYFNISPLVLILSTVIFYFGFIFISNIFASRSKTAEKCEITLYADEKSVNFTAIIDTGNSIEDIFGKSEIIIADKSVYYSLFGNIENSDKLKLKYRIVPCSTVSGTDYLDGYRCDTARIKTKEQEIKLNKPILAVSKEAIKEDYSAIINPKIFI